MGRREFETIKSNIKFHKPDHEEAKDKAWRLKNQKLRATGTVRKDRIKVSNGIDAKARRGISKVKHDSNSVMDSKAVSILSSAAGVTHTSNVSRYDKEAKGKAVIPFPNALKVYNNFMGGVDLHDHHCNNLMPIIRAKKWTWTIFIRLIQASITNATVL
ncbi:piggyBac transposable element-derived protein 3-like [Belonocnema kinseyi]|uniref:piggyBac transposable element-derived protein 3-like n=1 Tax=Belonocnema kinseyi TaxID=2817044 RepID=UPI00143DA2DB|nr:piggyBac transposable element-derived protein 3-like [Belonocnema kinseyi]